MSFGLPVVAVVDATGSTAVVWWVDVEASGLNRLCGAWALPEARAQQMRDLLFGRYVLATSGGEGLLDALGVQDGTPIDPELTLTGVARVGEQLQEAHCLAPGLMEAVNLGEVGSHGRTEEVPR